MRLNHPSRGVDDGSYFFRGDSSTIQPFVNSWLANPANLRQALLTANNFQSALNNFVHGLYLSDYWIKQKITQVMTQVHNLCYFTLYNYGYKFQNMKTFSERLIAAMTEAGLSQGQLAEAVGISQPAIQKMTSGKTNGSRKMVELAGALGVKPEWLSTGEGPMRNDGQQPKVREVLVTEDFYRVDVLDVQASAGPGSMVSSDFIETIRAIEYTSEKGRALFGSIPAELVKVITVRGDSMEGTIDPGDEIFVNTGIRGFDGDGIYVFVFGNTLHVKRLQMHKDQLLVISDNTRYKEWYIEDSDHDRFHIMAKVLIKQTIAYKRFG